MLGAWMWPNPADEYVLGNGMKIRVKDGLHVEVRAGIGVHPFDLPSVQHGSIRYDLGRHCPETHRTGTMTIYNADREPEQTFTSDASVTYNDCELTDSTDYERATIVATEMHSITPDWPSLSANGVVTRDDLTEEVQSANSFFGILCVSTKMSRRMNWVHQYMTYVYRCWPYSSLGGPEATIYTHYVGNTEKSIAYTSIFLNTSQRINVDEDSGEYTQTCQDGYRPYVSDEDYYVIDVDGYTTIECSNSGDITTDVASINGVVPNKKNEPTNAWLLYRPTESDGYGIYSFDFDGDPVFVSEIPAPLENITYIPEHNILLGIHIEETNSGYNYSIYYRVMSAHGQWNATRAVFAATNTPEDVNMSIRYAD